jgi:CheY-like chemotaxis protein
MIVDDDPFIRTVTESALSDGGQFDVRACGSGAEAVATAAAFQPDLVLLDMRMKGMSGPETWAALTAALDPAPRMVFVTADDDASAHDEALVHGALGVITKPFNPATLSDQVRRFVGHGPASAPATKLEAIAAEFRASLTATIETIDHAWAALLQDRWQHARAVNARESDDSGLRPRAVKARESDDIGLRPRAETLLSTAHILSGSAGLFHLHAIGGAADRLEEMLVDLLKRDQAPGEGSWAKLENAVDELVAACRSEAA